MPLSRKVLLLPRTDPRVPPILHPTPPQEMVGDDALEDIEKWVDFIKEESGVSIVIEA